MAEEQKQVEAATRLPGMEEIGVIETAVQERFGVAMDGAMVNVLGK